MKLSKSKKMNWNSNDQFFDPNTHVVKASGKLQFKLHVCSSDVLIRRPLHTVIHLKAKVRVLVNSVVNDCLLELFKKSIA